MRVLVPSTLVLTLHQFWTGGKDIWNVNTHPPSESSTRNFFPSDSEARKPFSETLFFSLHFFRPVLMGAVQICCSKLLSEPFSVDLRPKRGLGGC